MYEIESGIEIPECAHFGKPKKYHFDLMKIGDSFAIPVEGMSRTERNKVQNNILGASRPYKKAGLEFVTRFMPNENPPCIRCWRTV